MFFRSIRFKIILWYMALLTLTLAAFSMVFYNRLSYDLYGNLDDLLQSRVEGIADSIDTYWEVEKLEAKKNRVRSSGLVKPDDVNFAAIAQHWVKEESDDPDLFNIIVQIFDAKGESIASSQNISQPIVVPKKIFVAALHGKQRFDTTTATFSPDKELLLRVLTMPVVENKTVAYIIQVARSLDTVQSALDNFKAILFVLLPLVVFITGIISAFLAKITLNPVDRIIKTVQKTTAENLKLRIPVPNTKDEVQRLAATFNDMLERLEKAFSSQRHFIQDASHELKTPLTILQGELEVTLKKIRSVDEYESVLNSGLEEIKRISKIVEDLLLLARFEDRETALDRREFDINRLLQSAIDELAVLAQHKKITVAFSADHSITINGDEQRLKQVFLNILDNAIKYTPSGGTISLSVSVTSHRVEISIADTGIGIPHTDLPHIFDRFYRIDKSRNSSGFGLGLSIAKTIIEAHQGSISADSVINHGTTFTISLPVTAPSH